MTTQVQPVMCLLDLTPDFLPSGVNQVAWDIETTGLDWKRDRIASCQLSPVGGEVAVVRIEDGRTPQVLRELLADPSVLKVFHHAPFDLRFMCSAWNVEPRNVACTKLASKILEPSEPDHSLKALLQRHLNITIDKTLQTSNWRAEHWSEGQIEYAVADVLHLHSLLDVLKAELSVAGRDELAAKCFEHLPMRVQLEIGEFGDVFAY